MTAYGTGWSNHNDAPIDPAYLAFVDGLRRYWGGFELPRAIRWDPRVMEWHTFKPPAVTLQEVGIPDGPRVNDPNEKSYFGDKSVEWWDAVKAKYRSISAKYPYAVWNPQTGEWFNVLYSKPVPKVPAPPGPRTGKNSLPDWLLQEIADIRAQVNAGNLSPSDGEAIIQQKLYDWFT